MYFKSSDGVLKSVEKWSLINTYQTGENTWVVGNVFKAYIKISLQVYKGKYIFNHLQSKFIDKTVRKSKGDNTYFDEKKLTEWYWLL